MAADCSPGANQTELREEVREFLAEEAIMERTRDCDAYFDVVQPWFLMNEEDIQEFPIAMAIKVCRWNFVGNNSLPLWFTLQFSAGASSNWNLRGLPVPDVPTH